MAFRISISRSKYLAFRKRNSPRSRVKGILFALDVAGLDLWANELIILIACETAVGDVKIGEGVKGLRSAFYRSRS